MWVISLGVAYLWLVKIGIVERILRPSPPSRFVTMTGGTNGDVNVDLSRLEINKGSMNQSIWQSLLVNNEVEDVVVI